MEEMKLFLSYLYKEWKGKGKGVFCWPITPQSQAQSGPGSTALMSEANRFEQAMTTAGNNRDCLYRKTCYPSLPTALAQHNPNASMSLLCKQTQASSSLFTSQQTHSFSPKNIVTEDAVSLFTIFRTFKLRQSGWQRFCPSQKNQCVFYVICQLNFTISTTKIHLLKSSLPIYFL